MNRLPARLADKSVANPIVCDALDGVPHGFFGHDGGRLQFGFGAEADDNAIRKIRQSACNVVLPSSVLTAPHQVHSADVLNVTDAWPDDPINRPQADALVTAHRGITLGIVTADCAPVLFADKAAGVIGAAHAGWRGAHGGVLENTLEAMETLGAQRERIIAVVGPTIAQCSYEVDDGFKQAFDDWASAFFAPGKPHHWQFDLPAYIVSRLQRFGVEITADLALDTYAQESRFYSFRRATHLGKVSSGRQISMIALAKN